mgnify:CR=1 FL=1
MEYKNIFEIEFIQRTQEIVNGYQIPFENTLFINACVGLLIIPQQSLFNHLPTEVVSADKWGIADTDISCIKEPNKSVKNVARHIRNAIAHDGIRFGSDNGKDITHIKITDWKDERHKTETFKAVIEVTKFTPQMRKYAKIEELTQGEHKQVTLIYGEKNDREFEREILAALQGVPYARHNYRYAVKEGDQGLSSLLANGKDNLLIVLSDSGLEVDRILAAIASANTNLVARGKTPPRFTIVGNSRWNRFGNLDRALYFKDRLVLFSTYHAKRDAEVIKTFDSDYIKAFGALPSLYSYRGYDAAMIFVPAMYSDIQYDMEGRRYTPLQTSYTFQQMPGGSNHVNQNWMRVSYRPDFTITVD